MTHLENIHKLFGRNFVENPLIESFDAGKLNITSGKLVVSDPLTTAEMPPFGPTFPLGAFPVLVHKERDSNCIAYIEVVLGEAPVDYWEMAVSDSQNPADLKEGEIYGFPGESGMGCIMDAETQQLLNDLEQHLFHRKGADFMGIYEEFFHEHFFEKDGAVNQFAFLIPHDDREGNVFAFETGYGEGFYATYIGYSVSGEPVKLLTELIEIN